MSRPPGLPKTGGRQPGTPNRITKEARVRLEELGCDPIESMVRIANDPHVSPELRGKMFAELAGYIHPKRRAVEHTDDRPKQRLEIVVCRVDQEYNRPAVPPRVIDVSRGS
jgi:hypothetical protein